MTLMQMIKDCFSTAANILETQALCEAQECEKEKQVLAYLIDAYNEKLSHFALSDAFNASLDIFVLEKLSEFDLLNNVPQEASQEYKSLMQDICTIEKEKVCAVRNIIQNDMKLKFESENFSLDTLEDKDSKTAFQCQKDLQMKKENSCTRYLKSIKKENNVLQVYLQSGQEIASKNINKRNDYLKKIIPNIDKTLDMHAKQVSDCSIEISMAEMKSQSRNF